jgi:predicted Zn finger-like uncharacterized protein
MPEEKYTRCPGCATVFRVTPEQLAMRAGQVRCGQCKSVFDGIAQLVSLSPSIRSDLSAPPVDEAALGPPTVTLRDAQALEMPAELPEQPSRAVAAGAETASEDRFAPTARAEPSAARLVAYALAIVFLVLLVAAQTAFHFRDAIIWPVARPAFVRLCAVAGCAGLCTDAAMSHLAIEASDLQPIPRTGAC